MTKTLYIAHRGFAARRTENTLEAFSYAAKKPSADGIETDVHVTKDGRLVCFHDDSTLRLCGEENIIEDTDAQKLARLGINGQHAIPTLAEYLEICRNGDKIAVIELKNPFTKRNIARLVQEIRDFGYLAKTIFISFDIQNCLSLRKILPPQQEIQFLTITYAEKTLELLAKQKIDLDVEFSCLSKERIEHCHDLGMKVNCWPLDDARIADHFEDCGIDFITSNILGSE